MILNFLKVFSIAVNMLLTAYGAGVVAGATSPFLPCKIVAVRIPLFFTRNLALFVCLLKNLIFILNFFFLQIIGHSALAALLWRKAQTVDLTDPPSMQSFYMFIFKASGSTLVLQFWIISKQVLLFTYILMTCYFIKSAAVLCRILPYALRTLRMREHFTFLSRVSFSFFFPLSCLNLHAWNEESLLIK